ncbi:MAG: hypothetical protein VXZ82_06905 [Planctomycetota bacterium]|nr:hypothetical protein [Planctomycetota bacterium]
MLRFSNEEVLKDAEAITQAIAAGLSLEYQFI